VFKAFLAILVMLAPPAHLVLQAQSAPQVHLVVLLVPKARSASKAQPALRVSKAVSVLLALMVDRQVLQVLPARPA
jgi:hypothetical protein